MSDAATLTALTQIQTSLGHLEDRVGEVRDDQRTLTDSIADVVTITARLDERSDGHATEDNRRFNEANANIERAHTRISELRAATVDAVARGDVRVRDHESSGMSKGGKIAGAIGAIVTGIAALAKWFTSGENQ